MTRGRTAGVFSALWLVVAGALPAWAVQTHGGAEGLVSHQLGHLLFISAVVFLLVRLGLVRETGPGWREFMVFLWGILLWNCLTSSGHWLDEYIPSDRLIRIDGSVVGFRVTSFSDAYYYLTRLDHLLLVPSFLYLLLALRKWRATR